MKVFEILVILIISIVIYLGIRVWYSIKNKEGFENPNICSSSDSDYSACYDASYVNMSNKLITGAKVRLNNSHYIDMSGIVQSVPYGYARDPSNIHVYIPKTETAVYSLSESSNTSKMSITSGQSAGKVGLKSICRVGDSDYSNPASCFDISYINLNGTVVSGQKARILPGYYINARGLIESAPLNTTISPNKRYYVNNPTGSTTTAEIARAYNSLNLDITYHSDPTKERNDKNDPSAAGLMWIRDASGNLVQVPFDEDKIDTGPLYYEPGAYRFGPSKYVPKYDESVFLSKLTNEPTVSPYKTITQGAGFCPESESTFYGTEEKCQQLDKDVCAATSCCVLLGGQKCVAGSVHGPSNRGNYGDQRLTNRDYYYYKGKCYGNCP